jgi:hypothetical protein
MEVTDRRRTVWLHVHVPKAGGSTLRQLMNRNFGEGYYNSNSLLETKQYVREEVSEIIRCHDWLKCFSDHKLSLDLPYESEHAEIYALAFVREPVDRFISRYFFHRHFEEVNCIAQRMSFREFAHAELVEQYVHPQTNSQIYFLNGGRSFDDITVIQRALETGRVLLFPIERFDEACIVLERLFPLCFSDLSYVRANVSQKDQEISEGDRQFVNRYLKIDYPVFKLANQQLDQTLAKAFRSLDDRQSALAEFRDRCSRRHHNFHPPRPAGQSPRINDASDANDRKSNPNQSQATARPAHVEQSTPTQFHPVRVEQKNVG